MAYDGFISYSHAADGRLAPALQRGLERLAKRWNSRRALRVFRDETGLSTNPHLWSAIERALDDSDWFVLLASPEAAASEWVDKEVAHWLATKSVDHLLPVVADGTWEWDPASSGFTTGSTAVPQALRAAVRDEPRHLDLRWARGEVDLDLRNSRFRAAVADLAAPMHGLDKDELEGEDIRQHRRARRLARSGAATLAVLLVVALVSTGFALNQRDRADSKAAAARRAAAAADAARRTAEDARTVSDATRIGSQARVLSGDQLDLALLLAVQGRQLVESTTTDGALEAVLSQEVPRGVDRVVNIGALASDCSDASPDGRQVAAAGADGTVRLFDTTTGRVVRSLPGNLGTGFTCTNFSADGTRLVGSGGNGNVFVWDVTNDRQLAAMILPATSGDNLAAFGGDNRIVTATPTGVVAVWDITDPGHSAAIGAPYSGSIVIPGVIPFPTSIFLAPGSDLLAFVNASNTEVWDIRTHTRAYAPLPGVATGEAADGSMLATTVGSGPGAQVRLWDLATGRPRGQPLSGLDPQLLGKLFFSRDGQRAAIQSGAR